MTGPAPSAREVRRAAKERERVWRRLCLQMHDILAGLLTEHRATLEAATLNGMIHTLTIKTLLPSDGVDVLADPQLGGPIHLQPPADGPWVGWP